MEGRIFVLFDHLNDSDQIDRGEYIPFWKSNEKGKKSQAAPCRLGLGLGLLSKNSFTFVSHN